MSHLTQSAYAAHRKAQGLRGTSARAVRRALASGRIHSERGGGIDPDRADREWAGSTRLRVDGAVPASRLSAMTLRERTARAKTLELELGRKSGELVSAREVEWRWSKIVTDARTAILGVPSRLKQVRPNLSAADLLAVDTLLREALTALADGGLARAKAKER